MGPPGIRKVFNGPFTFSPDGNPLVGPIRGLRGYWVACGVVAGPAQGGCVGLALVASVSSGWGRLSRDVGLDDVWRSRRQRYGYLGDGRRPVRRLRDARLHEREGPGEL